jgi:hypothetical protein
LSFTSTPKVWSWLGFNKDLCNCILNQSIWSATSKYYFPLSGEVHTIPHLVTSTLVTQVCTKIQKWSYLAYVPGQIHNCPICTSATDIGMCIHLVHWDMSRFSPSTHLVPINIFVKNFLTSVNCCLPAALCKQNLLKCKKK